MYITDNNADYGGDLTTEKFEHSREIRLYVYPDKIYSYRYCYDEETVIPVDKVIKLCGIDDRSQIVGVEHVGLPDIPLLVRYETYDWCFIDTVEGWFKANGQTYYGLADGEVAKGLKTIDSVKYKFENNGILMGKYTGWAKTASNTRYYYDSGVKVTKNTTVGDMRYCFNKDGVYTGKYTGWTKSSLGRRYFLDGKMQIGEVTIDEKVYIFDENGYLI